MADDSAKIYFIYINSSTFVRTDIKILEQRFNLIKTYDFNQSGKSEIINLFRSAWQAIITIPKVDIVYSFFVGYHTLFPFLLAKLLGKKVVCALGGTECHFFPEIDYGNYRKKLYAFFTRRSLELADLILPVDETLIKHHVTYIDAVYPNQGIVAFNKTLKAKIEAVNCGFEFNLPESAVLESTRLENSFITASLDLSGFDFYRKGIDLILDIAPSLPEASFSIIGDKYDYKKALPSNVKIIGRVSHQELYNAFLNHQFYLQLSIAEGFPNALAESMLYGCIPIGSDAFGIPNIIANNGYILHKKNKVDAVELLRKAMSSNCKKGFSISAHNSIKQRFTFQKRADHIAALIQELN
jgi:glycosyltransferase involved in cell wall biosynthesis